MAHRNILRRKAISTASVGALGTLAIHPFTVYNFTRSSKLALLGGDKARNAPWPEWPVWDTDAEKGVIDMLRSGRWWRGSGEHVAGYQKRYGRRCKRRHKNL